MPPDPRRERLVRVAALHDEIDAEVARLAARHRERLQCRLGCDACCVDGIRVFEVEAERIRAVRPELLREAPHPPGACAFLDAGGGCRIYAERPYVCRTQGLPLRWIDDEGGAHAVERRDICPLNEAGPPLETLPEGECWTLGPVEARLAALQAEADGGRLRRVRLRDLFESRGAP